MNGCMMNYYFLKEVLKQIPEEIQVDLVYTDSLLFNFANFMDIPDFAYIFQPFKKDKYKLSSLYRNSFDSFCLECTISLNMKNDYKRLLFLYSQIAITTLRDIFIPRAYELKHKLESLDEVYNMIDIYLAERNETDITKKSLYSLFPEAYVYYDYVEDLIHNPLIRCYKFMGSKGIYKKGYKKFRHYCKHDSNQRWKSFFHNLWDLLFARKKKGKKYLIYQKHIPKPVLNFTKENEAIKNEIDSIFQEAMYQTLDKISGVNELLFNHKSNKFKKKFNIPEDKKI